MWVDENGEIQEIDYSEEEMQDRMNRYCEIFDGLLPPEHLDVIRQLSEKRFQKCTYNHQGHWLALLSSEEEKAMVRRYLNFRHLDDTFVWYPK